jgi:density-regulated protein DRP1
MDVEDTCAAHKTPPPPLIVEYDPITGVPPEFNEFLPPDSVEYKKWKASLEGPEALDKLTLKDKEGNEIEKKLPGGKVKTKQKAFILLETKERQKNKKTTSVTGLELFGIKLSDAAKVFGKKFACGASVTKTATLTEQIEMQGDFLHQLAELILKNYAKTNNVTKDDIFFIG